MFDEIQRELRRLERGVQIRFDLPLDEKGYLDRRCPHQECGALFKVLYEDWRDNVRDEAAFCPICRAEAPATEWNTLEQQQHFQQVAKRHVQRTISTALRHDARRLNRSQKPGFINISLSARQGAPVMVLPIAAAETMQQEAVCEVCQCRYAAIGTVFFCPACGHNSVVAMYSQTVSHIRKAVAQVPDIHAALAPVFGDDTAKDTIRLLLENSLLKLVSAFQRYAETMFDQLTHRANVKRHKNVFQNLPASSKLWKDSTGSGYEDLLTPADIRVLNRLFQQRHLLAHRDGIVDQEYLDKTSDGTYSVGQRLVIMPEVVLQLCGILDRLKDLLSQLVTNNV